MRVGVLTTSYPRFDTDIAGDFVRGHARALASFGHSLHVLAPEDTAYGPPLCDPFIDVEHVAYLRPRRLQRTFYGAGVPDNLRRDPRAWAGLLTFPPALLVAASRHAHSWDAVVSHWALPSALVARSVGRTIPHVAIFHSADVHLLEHLPLGRMLAELVDEGSTRLVFVSEDLAARFRRVLGRVPRAPTTVLPMGFEPSDSPLSRTEARRRLALCGFVVFAMGRLVPIKGLDLLIRALRGLDDVTLVVAGEGPERGRLEAEAASSGVRVRWTGIVRGEAKAACLRAADVFTHPSIRAEDGRTEGAPVAVLEAMHEGLPIVASDTGGLASLVRDGGVLFPEGDELALRSALLRLRADPTEVERIGRLGRDRAAAHTWLAVGPTFEAMLHPAR